jgi:hypothetical protein
MIEPWLDLAAHVEGGGSVMPALRCIKDMLNPTETESWQTI